MGDAAILLKDVAEEEKEQQQSPPPLITKLKISSPLTSFPDHIFDLADSLEHLDLSGTGLTTLPPSISRLTKLKIAFFSQCGFAVFPRELASCPALEMVAFRGNGMREIPEGSLPPNLRWLILTNNRIRALPRSIGSCARLQKCMLAGNELESLPDEMAACRRLGLLRLSANRLRELPRWLFTLPELAFLSFAGNPCCSPFLDVEATGTAGNSTTTTTTTATTTTRGGDTVVSNGNESTQAHRVAEAELARVSWTSLDVHEVLGEGASGVVSKGTWDITIEQPQPQSQQQHVAIKLFKGGVTSDGTPADEMRACIQAGSHPNLIDPLGRIHDHPSGAEGLVMQLVPARYRTLGLPPSLQSCTRDHFPATAAGLRTAQGLSILRGIAGAAAHVHERGVAHGDLYAHNILFDDAGHALLGDFGAASTYRSHYHHHHDHHHRRHHRRYDDDASHDTKHHPQHLPHAQQHQHLEQVEVLAFAHLIEDVWRLIRLDFEERELRVSMLLASLHRGCATPVVADRPKFSEVHHRLCEIGEHLSEAAAAVTVTC